MMSFLQPDTFLFSSIPAVTLLLLAVGLLVSSVGFLRLVYFISIGYGFSVAAMSLVLLGFFAERLEPVGLTLAVTLALYGLRLGGYLWLREFQSAYAKEKVLIAKDYAGRDLGRKTVVWLGVSVLYVVMVTPLVFTLQSASSTWNPVAQAGLVVAVLGLLLETAADLQKASFKKKQPDRFCDSGLFRVVRNPNYLGEILVWLGVFVAGIPACGNDPFRWGFAASGLVIIVLIMLGSARRLELKQEGRYGALPEWQTYAAKTPVLFPLVPLMTLKNLKVFLG